jgi:competence protein ComEA
MFRQLLTILLTTLALSAFAAVDANQASRADLETVKGIGPGLSAKILEARKTAAFRNWDDLVERVGGIGPGNAAKFSQAGLTVSGAAYDAKTATAKPTKAPRAGASTAAKSAEKSAERAATKAAAASR